MLTIEYKVGKKKFILERSQRSEIMKNRLWAVVILVAMIPRIMVGATPDQGKNVPEWVQEHQKDHAHGRHVKKTKPPRKIAGTAKKGAPRVSPLVVKKDK
jgi:hypothetical protein